MFLTRTGFAFVALMCLGLWAFAEDSAFELRRQSVDGGGGTSIQGDGYELSGTIGQADATLMVLRNDGYELTAGFWFRVGPADCNTDGVVNNDDFNIIINNFFTSVTPGVWALGDPTGDGFVGSDDFNIVINNMGNPAGGVVGPVPEPSTLALALAVFCGAVSCRQSRCSFSACAD